MRTTGLTMKDTESGREAGLYVLPSRAQSG
jgi:hypothetical protein